MPVEDEGKSLSQSPSPSRVASFPLGTSFATQRPPRLLPSFLHVLPAPFADPAVEQAYQAHFDRLKVLNISSRTQIGRSAAAKTRHRLTASVLRFQTVAPNGTSDAAEVF